jgi:hypothetical protein
MAADEDDCVSYALRMCSACWTDRRRTRDPAF